MLSALISDFVAAVIAVIDSDPACWKLPWFSPVFLSLRPSGPSIFCDMRPDRAFCCIFLLFKAVFLSNPWHDRSIPQMLRDSEASLEKKRSTWCIMVSYTRALLLIFSLCWPCIPNRNRSSRGQGAKGLLFWILFVLQTSKQNSNWAKRNQLRHWKTQFGTCCNILWDTRGWICGTAIAIALLQSSGAPQVPIWIMGVHQEKQHLINQL